METQPPYSSGSGCLPHHLTGSDLSFPEAENPQGDGQMRCKGALMDPVLLLVLIFSVPLIPPFGKGVFTKQYHCTLGTGSLLF